MPNKVKIMTNTETETKNKGYTNTTEVYSEGYCAGYNQAMVDFGFRTRKEATEKIRSLRDGNKLLKELTEVVKQK
jgi:hypothetical protein